MSSQPSTTNSLISAAAFAVAGTPPVRRFTVDEYHRIIDAGILGEQDRVELVDGWIVEMSPIGPPHATAVSLVFAALQRFMSTGWFVRAQGPITLPTGEPEPDLAVVRGTVRDYRNHHPGSADIGLVIEVADASLQFDRMQKRAQYASAGIPEYWIVNLVDRCVETYSDLGGGDYRSREFRAADGSVELTIDGKRIGELSVADLLP